MPESLRFPACYDILKLKYEYIIKHEISVLKEYRNKGIGTRLMREILFLLKKKGYKRVSLSVQKANFAVSMYEKAGFFIVAENDEEYLMAVSLN